MPGTDAQFFLIEISKWKLFYDSVSKENDIFRQEKFFIIFLRDSLEE